MTADLLAIRFDLAVDPRLQFLRSDRPASPWQCPRGEITRSQRILQGDAGDPVPPRPQRGALNAEHASTFSDLPSETNR